MSTSLPVSSKLVELYDNEYFHAAVSSMNGHRESMEDTHCILVNENFGFFAVFDGHAGPQCAIFCSNQFEDSIKKVMPPGLSDQALKDLCCQIDQKFLTTLAANPLSEASDAGCTAAFFIAIPDPERKDVFDLQIGNIGDARVLVGDRRGRCVLTTLDHKPNLEGEKHRIQASGGKVSHGKVDGLLGVSRALGDIDFKSNRRRGPLDQRVIPVPDIVHTTCNTQDHFVLVACDGIFESDFTNEQVVEFISKELAASTDTQHIAVHLCDEALRRGSKDNMTVVLVTFQDGGSSKIAKSFHPGPFFRNYPASFWKTYTDMAKLAGLHMGRCIELRYDFLKAVLSGQPQTMETDSEVPKLQEELDQYEGGPEPELTGEQRTDWFSRLVVKWSKQHAPNSGFYSDSDDDG